MSTESRESVNFDILNSLNRLGQFTLLNVPDDKLNSTEIQYHILSNLQQSNHFLVVQKPKTGLNKAFLEMQNQEQNFNININGFGLSDGDKTILEDLEHRGYIITSHTGVPFATGETRPFPFSPEALQTQPTELEIIRVYTEIIQQIYLFTTRNPEIGLSMETKFAKDIDFVATSLTEIVDNSEENTTSQGDKNFILEKVAEIKKLVRNSKSAAFMRLSAGQISRITKYSKSLEEIRDRLGLNSGCPPRWKLMLIWFKNVFCVNLKNMSKFRPEINFFQARDVILESQGDGKVTIAHLEQFKYLPPHTSLARILADAFKLCSQDELEVGSINPQNRTERFAVLLALVYDLIPSGQLTNFDSVLTGVLIDTLTDVIQDAGSELDKPENLDSENRAEITILSQTTNTMINAILNRLALV